jgi:hypothetical protein
MAKYKPESKGNLEKRVKDLSRKAKDCTKHMSNVRKELKAISHVSREIKSSGTIETGEGVGKALHDTGRLIRKEFNRWREALENVAGESHRTENEFKERIKYSMSNYEGLTHVSGSIKETTAARDKIIQGMRFSQEDTNMLKEFFRILRGVRQSIQDMSYRLDADTSLRVLLDERGDEGLWAEFTLNPQEIKDIVEEHLMDVELRGPVPAKDRREIHDQDEDQ